MPVAALGAAPHVVGALDQDERGGRRLHLEQPLRGDRAEGEDAGDPLHKRIEIDVPVRGDPLKVALDGSRALSDDSLAYSAPEKWRPVPSSRTQDRRISSAVSGSVGACATSGSRGSIHPRPTDSTSRPARSKSASASWTLSELVNASCALAIWAPGSGVQAPGRGGG